MYRVKRTATLALLAAALLAAGCSSMVPWGREPVGEEVNLVFSLENNLLYLPSLDVDGREGRFLFASAAPRSVLDPAFALPRRTHALQLSEKQALRFSPVRTDLEGVADGIIGADVWGTHAVTLDYRAGLLTYQKAGIHPAYMSLYPFDGAPSVTVEVDGRAIVAVIDTASPDTLILPSASERRGSARVALAGASFGTIDVRYSDVARPRIGNRLLSRFLITIDYGKRVTGFWRDPRIGPALSADTSDSANDRQDL